ncbi:MAG: cupin domain-containing protein [Tissierellia bacterium]|nr:cupin domain-containing protein [Tissierellia bacterium]
MIEKIYNLKMTDEDIVEKVIADDYIHYNHMVLTKGNSLPVHNANSNVYMTVLRGTLSLDLEDQKTHAYTAGTIINIPKGTKMHPQNLNDEILEFIVIKAPAPKHK